MTKKVRKQNGYLRQEVKAGLEWGKIGELLRQVLGEGSSEHRDLLEAEAAHRGVTVEHLAAAAIGAIVRERIETSAGGTLRLELADALAELRGADTPAPMRSPVDWGRVGDLVCQVLGEMYREHRGCFEAHAAERGCTLDQVAAAAITQMVQEQIEGRERLSVPRNQPSTRVGELGKSSEQPTRSFCVRAVGRKLCDLFACVDATSPAEALRLTREMAPDEFWDVWTERTVELEVYGVEVVPDDQ
jgi:hypothetical protein